MVPKDDDFLAQLRREVRRGFLPLWILEQLESGPAYGYQLMERIAREYGEDLRVQPSTLYPTLSRMRSAGLVQVFHGTTSAGPLRKYYELTDVGRARLPAVRAMWHELARAPDPKASRRPTSVESRA